MNLIFWTWCLPQTILGFIFKVYLMFKKDIVKIKDYKNINLIVANKIFFFSGLSLGKYIFVTRKGLKDALEHEYGHIIQNYILGPFYLIFVGVPSIILALISLKSKYVRDNYLNFYPESWAERLCERK